MGRTLRKFSLEFEARVVLDILTSEKSLGQASREHGIIEGCQCIMVRKFS